MVFIKISAIISEYNPFHNGHKFHIEQTKALYADRVICVMSGYYTQRGDVAIMSKWQRAKCAINGGADLVLELPLPYSVANAELFALGAVTLIERLGIVDSLSFGSECGDISTIKNMSDLLTDHDVNINISKNIKSGVSYPRAVSMSVNDNDSFLYGANNTLAIEYIKALKKLNSNITPVTIMRQGVSHNDNKIVGNFASATYLRQMIVCDKLASIQNLIPPYTFNILCDEIVAEHAPAQIQNFERMIIANLYMMTTDEISEIFDVSEGLEYRIANCVKNCTTFSELLDKIKCKRYTQARLRRVLLHSLLGITKSTFTQPFPSQVQVLAFNENGRSLIRKISNHGSISPVSVPSRMINPWSQADGLYNFALLKPKPLGSEFLNKPYSMEDNNV